MPKVHRPAAAVCANDRGAGNADPQVPLGDCKKDEDCTSGLAGRCLASMSGPKGNSCSYDACYADADCGGGQVCSCRATSSYPNLCVKGNCVADADCNGNYCSPSVTFDRINIGVTGYFCHTPADACVDDGDCGSTSKCAWNGTAWACSDKAFFPP